MKTITGIVVLLLCLPVVAGAETDEDISRCAQAAQQFASTPHAMSIGELDGLKSCINSQRAGMLGDAQQQRIRLERERRLARSSLREDF